MKLRVSKRLLAWVFVNLFALFILTDVIVAKKSFYEITIALTTSKLATVVLYAALLANTWAASMFVRWFCFGTLSPSETHQVNEVFYIKCIEMIINLTIFEEMESVNFWKFGMFMGYKMLHDCASARFSTLEAAAMPNKRKILHFTWTLWVFFVVDICTALHYFNHYCAHGVDVHMTLLLDASLMALTVFDLCAKVYLFVSDDGTSDTNGMYRFYLTFAVRLTQCLFLVAFSCVALSVASMPIYVIRQLLSGLRGITTTLDSFAKYRRLALQIDTKFRQPTAEELEKDDQCVICYDSMTVESAKRMPCGHMYHRGCLRRWFEKKSSCPYCRRELDESAIAAAAAAATPAQRPAAPAAPNTPLQPPAAAAAPAAAGGTPLAAPRPATPFRHAAPAAASSPFLPSPSDEQQQKSSSMQALYRQYLEEHKRTGISLDAFLDKQQQAATNASAFSATATTAAWDDEEGGSSVAALMAQERAAYERFKAAQNEYDACRDRLMRRMAYQQDQKA